MEPTTVTIDQAQLTQVAEMMGALGNMIAQGLAWLSALAFLGLVGVFFMAVGYTRRSR